MFQKSFGMFAPVVVSTAEAVVTAAAGTAIFHASQAMRRAINGENPETINATEHVVVSGESSAMQDIGEIREEQPSSHCII